MMHRQSLLHVFFLSFLYFTLPANKLKAFFFFLQCSTCREQDVCATVI
jgi:hypothetical protein